MRVFLVLLLGLGAGYGYGFYDGRHHEQPSVLRMMKGFRKPGLSTVQRAESLSTKTAADLKKHEAETMKAAEP